MSEPPFRILQLSDPHLFALADGRMHGICTAASLAGVLRQVADRGPPPDLVLVTGDLVQDESEAGYERLRAILQDTGWPVAVIPGNHDDPGILQRRLVPAGIQVGGILDRGPWRIHLLSSWRAGDDGGHLDDAELARLDQALAERPRAHGLVVLHHHPVPMGSDWLDTVGLGNAGDLFRILDRHPAVRGLAWGHVHQVLDRTRGGLRLLSAPSTCYQFLPGSPGFALDSRPPGYRWLELATDGTIGTRVEWVESWR